MKLVIRNGVIDDCEAINSIYNWYVGNSTITFDKAHWELARRELWFQQFLPLDSNQEAPRQHLYHLVVATMDNHLLGFAYNGSFRPKDAYLSSTEITIYTHPESDSGPAAAGIGSQLYNELFRQIAHTALHRAYAIIALPNERSIHLHQKFDFNYIGTLSEVGTKFGKRIDVAWYEKQLN